MKIKLTKADFSLLWHSLDILESDYATADGGDGDKFQIKMQIKIEKLRDKLQKLEAQAKVKLK